MISELSPGAKLSLKGKIFELQKQLNLIEIEKAQNKLNFPFHPTIYTNYKTNSDGKERVAKKDKVEIIKKVIF